jgi:protein-L-isoaspartate O-methyltransferase
MRMGRGPLSGAMTGRTSDTMSTVPTDPTAPRSRALAHHLASTGVLRSRAWRRAVERVPRDLFVPRFHEGDCERGIEYRLVDGTDPDQRERWITKVYDAGESLVTEYDRRTLRPTTSATMPRIVVAMLEALDVEPDHRVLEIGTGSGYSTALLCERLGSERVTTVDIGEEVVDRAWRRLRLAGYTPTLIVADGVHGHPPGAPYDRLIATCRTARVPASWVEQTRAGGVLVAVTPGGVVRLVRAGDGSATGRFLADDDAGFMPMQCHAPAHLARDEMLALVHGQGESRPVSPGTWPMLVGEEITAFWPLALLRLMPHADRLFVGPGRMAMVDLGDRSWILVDVDGERVTQGGPRRLWDLLEALYRELDERGRPSGDRLGLTRHADGSQCVWLDDPGSERRWEL